MQSIEEHRRALARQGIDPECMPREYWERYAAKRRAFKIAQRQGKPQRKGCNCCRLITEDEGHDL